jgi:hypothetical protein
MAMQDHRDLNLDTEMSLKHFALPFVTTPHAWDPGQVIVAVCLPNRNHPGPNEVSEVTSEVVNRRVTAE